MEDQDFSGGALYVLILLAIQQQQPVSYQTQLETRFLVNESSVKPYLIEIYPFSNSQHNEEKIYLVEETILKISRSGPSLCCF